jgi:hypothetical protein
MLQDLKTYDKDQLVENPTILTIRNDFITKFFIGFLYIYILSLIFDVP